MAARYGEFGNPCDCADRRTCLYGGVWECNRYNLGMKRLELQEFARATDLLHAGKCLHGDEAVSVRLAREREACADDVVCIRKGHDKVFVCVSRSRSLSL